MSPYDKESLGELLRGRGTWFGAKLVRLISEADSDSKERLHLGFPEEVEAVHKYQTGDDWKDRNLPLAEREAKRGK